MRNTNVTDRMVSRSVSLLKYVHHDADGRLLRLDNPQVPLHGLLFSCILCLQDQDSKACLIKPWVKQEPLQFMNCEVVSTIHWYLTVAK